VLNNSARNIYNRHLDTGLITLDRVVTQGLSSRSCTFETGRNDFIPCIPLGYEHPGYKPLVMDYKPESGGRPYSMNKIREFYGIKSNTRGKDEQTWPFNMSSPNKQRGGKRHTNKKSKYGGFFFKSDAKQEYIKQNLTHMPNFVSVALGHDVPSTVLAFAHATYLDINYVGVFRIPGMKNPAKTKIACFDLNEDGVKINYLPNTPGMMEAVANATDPKVGDDILPVMTTATGGGEGFLRKTRKNRD
jgi:hypothetical protein